MTALVLALLVHSVLPQDNRVRELIEMLENGAIESRSEAEHELLRLGDAAMPALRAAAVKGGAELRARVARVIVELEGERALRALYGEPKRVTVRARGTRLGELLDDVARQAGVTLDRREVYSRDAITVEAVDVSLLEALDRICRAHGKLDYGEVGPGQFKMAQWQRLERPAAYSGPFCVRLVRVVTAGPEGRRVAVVEFTGESDRYPVALRRFSVDLKEAVDDTGAVLGRTEMPPRRGSGFVLPRERFTLDGFAATATSVTLRGEATFAIPMGFEDAVFDNLASGEKREAGGWTIELTAMDETKIDFRIRGRTEDPAALVMVDTSGREHVTSLPRVHPLSADDVLYSVPLKLDRGGPLCSFSIRVDHKMRFKRIPFELRDVKLP